MNVVLPRISIVTPSLNQAKFLEEAIASVLSQNYPNVDYVVIDGGSTDGSVDIIRRFEGRLSSWVSEPDGGLYDALNKGFAKSTGEIMGWLNSDDKYTPWVLSVVGQIFSTCPEIEWLTTAYQIVWDERGRAVACVYTGGFNRESFLRGANLPGRKWHSRCWIQQESTFWRRSLWERAGARLDASFKQAGDFELWARFFQHAELVAVRTPLGGFRQHGQQMTANHQRYWKEAEQVLRKHGGWTYGRLESALRHALHMAIGGRPLKRLPGPLAALAVGVGVLYPTKVCLWEDDQWRVVNDYVV